MEFEYKRHGTLCLTANFDVATGTLILPTIAPTRTEQDVAAHITRAIDPDPGAPWIFDDFNAVLAKPFRWTYTGKPLRAD
jgi:hypothetical protein